MVVGRWVGRGGCLLRRWRTLIGSECASAFPRRMLLGQTETDILSGGTPYLYSHRPCRRSLDFTHIPMVYSGHLTIVPSDCDCIPARFSDTAAISSIASPINVVALLEVF